MSDQLWNAVRTRDARADGLFVYAVRTTGIYCRPSCASRKPRRDRVEFFPAASMAAARGYRACRRCVPDRDVAGPPALERIRRACRAIARHPDRKWSSDALAKAGEASVAQLQRAFRTVLGLSPRDYVAACRHRRFLDRLRKGRTVTDAIYDAGFGSPSRMYSAVRLPGMRPATYGRGGEGAAIGWTTIESQIGRVLVAATPAGLCFVEVGDTVSGLVETLRREFPRADIAGRSRPDLRPMAEAARAVADARPISLDVPVDIRGTAFQWRVWRALTRIPPGQTRTYTDVARDIGAPFAVRAVARACATNPVALVVPCHRVIGADGAMRGYRWGIERKRKLLETERQEE